MYGQGCMRSVCMMEYYKVLSRKQFVSVSDGFFYHDKSTWTSSRNPASPPALPPFLAGLSLSTLIWWSHNLKPCPPLHHPLHPPPSSDGPPLLLVSTPVYASVCAKGQHHSWYLYTYVCMLAHIRPVCDHRGSVMVHCGHMTGWGW